MYPHIVVIRIVDLQTVACFAVVAIVVEYRGLTAVGLIKMTVLLVMVTERYYFADEEVEIAESAVECLTALDLSSVAVSFRKTMVFSNYECTHMVGGHIPIVNLFETLYL